MKDKEIVQNMQTFFDFFINETTISRSSLEIQKKVAKEIGNFGFFWRHKKHVHYFRANKELWTTIWEEATTGQKIRGMVSTDQRSDFASRFLWPMRFDFTCNHRMPSKAAQKNQKYY